VHTNTPDEKAELIKDILALANTHASGRRWLIIGFDPKTHTYSGPPDAKLTQDHLEQLLSPYGRPSRHSASSAKRSVLTTSLTQGHRSHHCGASTEWMRIRFGWRLA